MQQIIQLSSIFRSPLLSMSSYSNALQQAQQLQLKHRLLRVLGRSLFFSSSFRSLSLAASTLFFMCSVTGSHPFSASQYSGGDMKSTMKQRVGSTLP